MAEGYYEKFYKTNWEETYNFWKKVIDRREKQIDILKEEIGKIPKATIKILDLGAGTGDEIRDTLSYFKDKRFEIIANDTSIEALRIYKEINFPHVKQVIFDKLENLYKILNEKFDIILFSHCLYGAELSGLFQKYLPFLYPKGAIIIFQASRTNDPVKVQTTFWKEVHGVSCPERLAEDVAEELSREGVSYELIRLPCKFYLDKLESLQRNGIRNLFVPFIMRSKNIPSETLDKIVVFVNTLQKDQILNNQSFAIIVRKP